MEKLVATLNEKFILLLCIYVIYNLIALLFLFLYYDRHVLYSETHCFPVYTVNLLAMASPHCSRSTHFIHPPSKAVSTSGVTDHRDDVCALRRCLYTSSLNALSNKLGSSRAKVHKSLMTYLCILSLLSLELVCVCNRTLTGAVERSSTPSLAGRNLTTVENWPVEAENRLILGLDQIQNPASLWLSLALSISIMSLCQW